VLVDTPIVRRLIAAQFPQWSALPIRPVADGGWDNQTFHLGDAMSVRLPRDEPYALAVEKEHRWLPILAPAVPLPIPVPLAEGAPGEGYPYKWSVYRWIDGSPAAPSRIGDLTTFAADLAAFLVALQGVDPAGGPSPGQHNWFRGGPLETYDADTRRAIAQLGAQGSGARGSGAQGSGADVSGAEVSSVRVSGAQVPGALVTEIWETALRATWQGDPVWFHGDVAAGNLLVRDGRLSAVIDFGTCGVGDPACDLAIAWTLFSGPSRAEFRRRLAVDDATWARGRGWALWKALITYADSAPARHVLAEITADASPR
jgi:aminoglycoside phosphotransferase (APT) family kinase protein